MFVVVTTVQLSAVVGVPKVTAVAVQPEFVVAVTFAGAEIVGRITSKTVTVAVPVAEFPLTSVTVSVTLFEPRLAQVKVFGVTDIDAIPPLSVEPLFI